MTADHLLDFSTRNDSGIYCWMRIMWGIGNAHAGEQLRDVVRLIAAYFLDLPLFLPEVGESLPTLFVWCELSQDALPTTTKRLNRADVSLALSPELGPKCPVIMLVFLGLPLEAILYSDHFVDIRSGLILRIFADFCFGFSLTSDHIYYMLHEGIPEEIERLLVKPSTSTAGELEKYCRKAATAIMELDILLSTSRLMAFEIYLLGKAEFVFARLPVHSSSEFAKTADAQKLAKKYKALLVEEDKKTNEQLLESFFSLADEEDLAHINVFLRFIEERFPRRNTMPAYCSATREIWLEHLFEHEVDAHEREVDEGEWLRGHIRVENKVSQPVYTMLQYLATSWTTMPTTDRSLIAIPLHVSPKDLCIARPQNSPRLEPTHQVGGRSMSVDQPFSMMLTRPSTSAYHQQPTHKKDLISGPRRFTRKSSFYTETVASPRNLEDCGRQIQVDLQALNKRLDKFAKLFHPRKSSSLDSAGISMAESKEPDDEEPEAIFEYERPAGTEAEAELEDLDEDFPEADMQMLANALPHIEKLDFSQLSPPPTVGRRIVASPPKKLVPQLIDDGDDVESILTPPSTSFEQKGSASMRSARAQRKLGLMDTTDRILGSQPKPKKQLRKTEKKTETRGEQINSRPDSGIDGSPSNLPKYPFGGAAGSGLVAD
ncbi:unnamed protein product, partial [Mesorhabditis spiculigera]